MRTKRKPVRQSLAQAPSGSVDVITATYDSECSRCGKTISAGESALWNQRTRRARHPQGGCRGSVKNERRAAPRKIILKRAAPCIGCGVRIDPGEQAFWNATDRSARHPRCAAVTVRSVDVETFPGGKR